VVREAVKRRIVGQFSARWSAARRTGIRVELGMAPDRVFDGYDVVDNDYYAASADAARAGADALRVKYKLPGAVFSRVGPVHPEKRICRAWSRRFPPTGPARDRMLGIWVLLGDGPEKPEVIRQIAELKDWPGAFNLPGFKPLPICPPTMDWPGR